MKINSKKLILTLGIGAALANVLVGGCGGEEGQELETSPPTGTTTNTVGGTPVPTLRDIK